jgi:hypothetical protein
VVTACVALGLLLGGLLGLIVVGFRAGEQPGDALLDGVAPTRSGGGVELSITNHAHLPLIAGLSLRRPGIRLRVEGGAYATLRTRRTTGALLPSRQSVIAVIAAGESERLVVPAEAGLGARAELVAVLGQPGRLRTVHRLVRLPSPTVAEPPPDRPVRVPA